MGIKQLYNDNLRKLPNEYGDVSVMMIHTTGFIYTVVENLVISTWLHLLNYNCDFGFLMRLYAMTLTRELPICLFQIYVVLSHNLSIACVACRFIKTRL